MSERNERQRKFEKAWRKYQKARAHAWDAFDAIEGPAWKEYQNIVRYHDTVILPEPEFP